QLRGWGYAPAPHPVFLSVLGIDPTTNQFGYAVNGRFGGFARASGGVTVPFQVALQAHLAVGPGPIRRSATRQRALDPPAPPPPLLTAEGRSRHSYGTNADGQASPHGPLR